MAVKKPYRRSNKHNALFQILLTNERNDKLAAARVDFTARGMLEGSCVEEARHQYLLSCMFVLSICDLLIFNIFQLKIRRRSRLRRSLYLVRMRMRMNARILMTIPELLMVHKP